MAETHENAAAEPKPRRPRQDTDATLPSPEAAASDAPVLASPATQRPRAYTPAQYASHSHRLLHEPAWLVGLAIRKAHLDGDFIELEKVRAAVEKLKQHRKSGRKEKVA